MDRVFKEELIELNFENQSDNKFEVIKEMILDLDSKVSFGVDKDFVISEVIKREELSTTGFGNNIAIAHAQIEGLKEAVVTLYRFNKEVKWDSLDGKDVKQAFVLLVPKGDVNSSHMKILSNLARKLMREEFVSDIKTIKDKKKIVSYLEKSN